MAKMLPMKSMKLDDEDLMEGVSAPFPLSTMDRPEYPYGLQITLTDKELEKMDLDVADAEAGGIVHLHAMARIISVSQEDLRGKKCCCIRLQIEDMCVESEDEENEEADEENVRSRRSRLYNQAED